MADDHQYYLRQRAQPPIPSGSSINPAVTTVTTSAVTITTSSSQLPLPSQPSQPRQLVEQPEQIQVRTVAGLPGVDEDFGSVTRGIDLASKPTDQTAVFPVNKQSVVANVGFRPPTSVSMQQAFASSAVSSEHMAYISGPQQEAVVVDSTDEADAEVASYFRDRPPMLQPAPFCYVSPSPCAASPADVVRPRTGIRQFRPISRQSVMSVHSRAGGGQSRASSRQSRRSVRSEVADPVVDLMNRVFDAQRADAAAQRADADRRELQLQADAGKRELPQQAKMEAEMVRREQEAADKARLQMRVQQLETAVRTQTACTTPPAVR